MKSSASESKPFQSRSKGEIPGWARRKEWLSHSKLKQAFLIYSDAKLFMYLIQCIRFGSWKVWRLNGTLLFRIIFCSKLSLKHLTAPSTFTHTFTCALDFTRSWCILDWACVRQRKCVIYCSWVAWWTMHSCMAENGSVVSRGYFLPTSLKNNCWCQFISKTTLKYFYILCIG